MHRFSLHNEEIHEVSDRVLSPGQVGLLSGWGVFSTIKVIDGVLFAFERHWARMTRDAALMRVPLPLDAAHVESNLLRLVEKNRAFHSTMRVVVVRNRGGMWEAPDQPCASDLIAFTARTLYQGLGRLRQASPLHVRQARHAASKFAGTKILAWAMNVTWLEEAQQQGFDEVITAQRARRSSRNAPRRTSSPPKAAWSGRRPSRSGCLPGITRDLLLTEVQGRHAATVMEKPLTPADLESADEVFITSTTRDLLPVAAI